MFRGTKIADKRSYWYKKACDQVGEPPKGAVFCDSTVTNEDDPRKQIDDLMCSAYVSQGPDDKTCKYVQHTPCSWDDDNYAWRVCAHPRKHRLATETDKDIMIDRAIEHM